MAAKTRRGHKLPLAESPALDFLGGGGEVAELIRLRDWSDSPLGPPEHWPANLKTLVATFLPAATQIILFWGEEDCVLYNDACASVIGDKHPMALGKPARESWAELWSEGLSPMLSQVKGEGQTVFARDRQFSVKRHGYLETVYFDISASPVRNEKGKIRGVLCVIEEVTERVEAESALRESEERQAFLLKLSDALRLVSDPVKIQLVASRLLGEHLAASRAFYTEIEKGGAHGMHKRDYASGLLGLEEQHQLGDFGKELMREARAGRTIVVADTATDSRLSAAEKAAYASIHCASQVAVPLVRGKELIALFVVMQVVPREWRASEVALIKEAAGRTWTAVESTRAERLTSRLAMIVEFSDDAIIRKDLNGIIETWNNGAERMFGYSAEEILGQPITILMPPDLVSEETEILRRMRRGESIDHYETVRQRKDGSLFDVLMSISPIRDGEGKIVAVSNISRDITERKRAESVLAESEDKLRALIKYSSDGIAVLDITGKIMFANPAAARILGYSLNELLHLKDLSGVTHPKDRDLVNQRFAGLINPGTQATAVYRARGKDGHYRWVEVTAHNMVNEPSVRGIIVNYRDLTPQKQAELNLANSERRYRFVVQNSSDIITVIDKRGIIKFQSPSVKRLLGTSRNRTGADIFKSPLVHPNDAASKTRFLQELIQSAPETEAKGEFRMKHSNGSWRYLEIVGVNLLHIPEVGGVVLSSRDVTDRKRFERQKDEFIAIASHELKTPVTSMKMYIAALQRRFARGGDDSAAQSIGEVGGQLDRLGGLIGDLLDVTKIESGQLRLHQDRFRYDELVKKIVATLQMTTDTHHIRIVGNRKLEIHSDRDRLSQVLTNLIENAIKYSPRSPEIIVSVQRDKSSVTTSVADKGLGIPKAQQKNLFKRFNRVESKSTRNYPGLGLGLFISARIIGQLGGEIWVKSKYHQGSQFYFRLPLNGAKEELAKREAL